MTSTTTDRMGGRWVDLIGALASGRCAIHCAVCALLPAVLGALGLGMLLGHEGEWVLTLIAIAFGAGALIRGWPRHRSPRVAVFLSVGIAGLLVSLGLEVGSTQHDHADAQSSAAVGILAGLSLIYGHMLSIRASGGCRQGSGD